MTTIVTTAVAQRRRPIAALAALEARRNVRSVWLWVGIAVSALMGRQVGTTDWQAGTYQGLQAACTAVAFGILVIGLGAGGRDHYGERPPLAEEAAIGPDARATARLLGLWPAWAVGSLWAVIVFVAVRIEGGLWVGDEPGRTDSAVYTLPEMLQPLLLFAFAGAAGVAIGRACRYRVPVAIGALAFSVFGLIAWAFQSPPMRYVTPIQTQPFQQHIGPASLDPLTLPPDWLLSAPAQFETDWARVIVHQPTAAGHDVYLLGLTVLCAGLAVRATLGRRLIALGIVCAIGGIVAQVALAPSAIDLARAVR